MNSFKRSVRDFVCAFLIFSIVLSGIALVAGKDFSEGTVVVDRKNGYAELFGVRFSFDGGFFEKAEKLICFNDNIFGKGFSSALKKTAEFTFGYIGDFIKMAYALAEKAVGSV